MWGISLNGTEVLENHNKRQRGASSYTPHLEPNLGQLVGSLSNPRWDPCLISHLFSNFSILHLRDVEDVIMLHRAFHGMEGMRRGGHPMRLDRFPIDFEYLPYANLIVGGLGIRNCLGYFRISSLTPRDTLDNDGRVRI